MKNKRLKYAFLFLGFIGVFVSVFLIIHPLKHQIQTLYFDTQDKIYIKSFEKPIEFNFKVIDNATFRYVVFIDDKQVYTNLNFRLLDINDNIVLDRTIGKYQSNIIILESEPISAGQYKLVISDLDNEPIDICVVKGNKDNYIVGDTKALKFVTYYRDNYYFYFWYPIFLFVFLFTIYPFVWNGDSNV